MNSTFSLQGKDSKESVLFASKDVVEDGWM
jgi:hypothetical protein